jgi:glucokinase
MFLGIEIGGTKLQLGVGTGDGSPPLVLERREVDSGRGAEGILQQIREVGTELARAHAVERIGIGFGGPVLADRGRVIRSHQVDGWDDFPLAQWCQEKLGKPAVIGNDCDVAAVAEARCGAGRGRRIVFYVTVGTGVGGGLCVDGRPYGGSRPAVAEIGHLRPGLDALDPHHTVESIASGRGIETHARTLLTDADPQQLTARHVAQAAAAGDLRARETLERACRTLGWAIAQTITLTAPEVVVVGGGVSLIGEELFFGPLRAAVRQYVFPPLAESYELRPAELGELVVVHGALALAAAG